LAETKKEEGREGWLQGIIRKYVISKSKVCCADLRPVSAIDEFLVI
jgi:hypothetical protein